jgi:hypothetical protein
LASLIHPTASTMTPGGRLAPYSVAALALIDLLCCTGIASVEPAPDVRERQPDREHSAAHGSG